jgi:transporter family-2 protein
MNNTLFLIIIAAIGGIAVSVQGQLMGIMDKGMGTKESVFLTYVLGGLIMLIYLLLTPGNFSFKALGNSIPLYTLWSGVLGLVIVSAISFTIPRLGLATAFTIVIAAQFIITALIEQFGWLGATAQPIHWGRLIGFFSIIVGVWLVAKN